MNKARSLLLAGIAGLLAGLTPVTVHAADGAELTAGETAVTTTSNAQFNIEAGTLALLEMPNLVFSKASVSALVKGPETLTLADSEQDRTIVVQDFRGTNTGWSLSGELAAFDYAGDTTKTLTATAATFDPVTATGTNVDGVELRGTNFSGSSATLVNASADRGSGTTTIVVTGAELSLPKTINVQAGDYQAKLTWTLSAQPEPTS
ncbi:WxL domain-containing protein [Lacticaseibacillus sp. GG6-2]